MLKKAIQDNKQAIERIATILFEGYQPDFEADDESVTIGPFVFCPFTADVPGIGNKTRKAIKWQLLSVTHIPGSFNPYNGGYPPEEDEQEVGTFDSIADALAEAAKLQSRDIINGILEDIDHEKMMEEEKKYQEEMDKMQAEKEDLLCPHGRQYHECNDCLRKSDEVYDAMRENRRFGRW